MHQSRSGLSPSFSSRGRVAFLNTEKEIGDPLGSPDLIADQMTKRDLKALIGLKRG